MNTVIIDGVAIKNPSNIDVGIFRLSKSGRLSSGKMTMEIIAQKRRIDLTWAAIRGTDLNQILDVLDANIFYNVQYVDPKDPDKLSTMIAYVGDINQTLHRTDGSRIWKNVTLPLIEQ